MHHNIGITKFTKLGITSIVIIIIVAALGITGFFNSENQKTIAALAVDSTNYSFGEISMKNGIVNHNFLLKNPAKKAVIIDQIVTSCMCTEAELRGKRFGMHENIPVSQKTGTINPGEEVPLTVYYDPNAHGPTGVGPFKRQIRISTNSETQPVLTLSIEGEVIP